MPENHELVDDLIAFFRDYYSEEIGQLAQHYPREQKSLYVDYDDLYRFDPDIADDVRNHPQQLQEYLEEALTLYDLPVAVDLDDAHVRLYNLPETDVFDVSEVSRHENIGQLLDIRGQVQKVSDVKPRLTEATWECQRCGTQTTIPQTGDTLQEPHECKGCERQGPFSLDAGGSSWIDHQYARLQQPPEQTKGGDAPSVDVHLEDDLIEGFDAGDRVVLTGMLDIEEPGTEQGLDFDTNLDARAVVKEESDYDDVDVDEHRDEIEAIASGERGDPYQLLIDSINPKHRGDEHVKLAVALQLFGGWAHKYPDGSRDRGDWHMLLLGDPGCGKSTFLRYVDQIAPRSTYASGKGATAAGMTAAAVADDFGDTEWGLEAGALVLADGGIACVDEIDKMQSDAVSSMHDALESQQVHVNKAGINATLNARTSLLAAGNPKNGRFERYRPKGEQIDMGPTLLSRFDLMFMVSDQPDREDDAEVVEHMVQSRQAAGRHTRGEELSDEEQQRVEPAIDRSVMRAYIAHAKQTCRPVIEDDEVAERLKQFFVEFRASAGEQDDDSPIPLTFRKVEAIQRLAESSARVRLSDTVEIEDVEKAIKLVTKSMKQVGYDPESGEFDADIIETGQSKSQRERREAILAIVGDLDGASIDEINERVECDQEVLEHDIGTLKENGRIYSINSQIRRT
ncbi:AAA domain-containing protein [Halomicrobium mukohataei]|uniref:DNA helicase n=1 Tax=Halomicrobium mukohataei TaxID=57705 RepID=A0A847UC83_9EURY|nr:minichromosome maintenance protein MCM [Halomicrobium mukohataei]NLV08894.1 AAA domain-containing protein [Halomicrobium mukohataei]